MERRTARRGTPVKHVDVGEPPPGLDTLVATMMRKAAVPGLSVAVVSRDRVLFARGYGMADLHTRAQASPATAYGGPVGDVLDAGQFLRMHLRDGELDGQRILAPATACRMRVIDQAGEQFNHGLGWFRRRTDSGRTWVEHYGTSVGFWNVLRLYPDRGVGVVVMTNSTMSYDFEPMFSRLTGASWW